MRKWIFDDFSALGVEMPDHVQIVGRIPNAVIGSDGDCVREGIQSSGHFVLLERLCLWIEVANLSALIFAEPNGSVRVDSNSALVGVRRGWSPLRDLQRLGIHFANLPRPGICEPDVPFRVEV